jgi:hypothetical protein
MMAERLRLSAGTLQGGENHLRGQLQVLHGGETNNSYATEAFPKLQFWESNLDFI